MYHRLQELKSGVEEKMTEPSLEEKKMKPKFWIDFNSFATYGNRVEAVIVVSPEYDLHHVVNMLHGPDTARALTLVFTRKKKKFGRRGYSLKQEWEQKPQKKRVEQP